MNQSTLPYWLALLVAFTTAYGVWRAWPERSAATRPVAESGGEPAAATPARPRLTEFQLTDQAGQPFDSKQLKGRVWVANFFFSSCPSTCLEQNRRLAELQAERRFKDVLFVSVTCDPDTDTPAVLAEYARRFHAEPQQWAFCTGPFATIQHIGKDMMGLTVRRQTHSERAAVFDRQGKIRGRFLITDTFQSNQLGLLRATLTTCLQEPAAGRPDNTLTTNRSAAPAVPADDGL